MAKHNPLSAGPTGRPLATRVRVAVSLLLILHLAAVFVAPFSAPNTIGASSPLAMELRQRFAPYIEAADLDHGYKFFAPDPGDSHLIRYELTFDDGREPVVGTLPDLNTHWPRLLYHRHFMLTESSFSAYASADPPEPPARPSAENNISDKQWRIAQAQWVQERARWARQRRLYETYTRSYVQHLLSVYGASKVKLLGITHLLPSAEEVLAGHRLTDDVYERSVQLYPFDKELFPDDGSGASAPEVVGPGDAS